MEPNTIQPGAFLMPPIVKLQLVRENTKPYQIGGPSDIVTVLTEYLQGEDREHLVAVLMDSQGQVNGIHTISIGDSCSSIANPREIFKAAIMTNSCSIVLAHNHPSGNSDPSREDILVTEKVIQAGKLLEIEVLDHVIIGNGNYHSMSRMNTVRF